MTEFKAHLLILATALIVVTAVFFALTAIEADGTLYAVAMALIGGAAADTSSRVVMHYGSLKRRRR